MTSGNHIWAQREARGRGKRLLISGVNRATTHADIYRMTA